MEPSLIRRPSAIAPLLLSLAALGLVVGYVLLVGPTRTLTDGRPDESAAARAFQLLLAAELPIMIWFAVRWLPRDPRQGLLVLALQIAAALVPICLVLVLEQRAIG